MQFDVGFGDKKYVDYSGTISLINIIQTPCMYSYIQEYEVRSEKGAISSLSIKMTIML